MFPREMPLHSTRSVATRMSTGKALPTSWSQTTAGPSRLPTFAARFTDSHVKRGCAQPVTVMAHAYMIFVTDSRWKACCDGTALVRMSHVSCLFWLPTWGIAMSGTPTGICPRVPNLWDTRLGGWKNDGGWGHESDKLPGTVGTLLHPTSYDPTTGQPPHDRLV